MAKAPWRPGIAVRAPRPTLAAPGQETPIWGQLGHQSAHVPRHRHDPKSLQFHRRLDQTFQEHESPLRYLSVTTPKYLMRLVFFNSQPASTCTHSCEEPVSIWHLPEFVDVVHHVEDRMLDRDVNDGAIREHPANFRLESLPFPRTPEVVDHQEAACEQVVSQAFDLWLGHGHVAHLECVQERKPPQFRVVEPDGVLV